MGLGLVKPLPQNMLGCSNHQSQSNTTDYPGILGLLKAVPSNILAIKAGLQMLTVCSCSKVEMLLF